MGEIFVEGLGKVTIAGDKPTLEESNAIVAGIASQTGESPTPQKSQTRALPPLARQLPPKEGPLGLMPPESRQQMRQEVEDLDTLPQLGVEMSPSVMGAAIGGYAFAPVLPPAGTLVGMGLGGWVGEIIGQELGVSPRSDLNVGLAASGPLLGEGVGQALRLTRRGAVKGMTSVFPVSTAMARHKMIQGTEKLESLGARILAKQRGLMAHPREVLGRMMRSTPVRISPQQLRGTLQTVDDLIREMEPLSEWPDVAAGIKTLKRLEKTIDSGISLDDLIAARSQLGAAVRQAERVGGKKLRSSGGAFAAVSKDLDAIAANPGLTGRQGRYAKALISRSKLEFSVDELEEGLARFVKKDAAQNLDIVNLKGFQKWLLDTTNPKSRQYNKNFTAALGPELTEIKETLAALAKFAEKTSPGGPASLVIRGHTARLGRAGLGALAGWAVGGPITATVGGVLGATAPEMIIGALLTPFGRKFLTRAATVGKGQISHRTWSMLGIMLARVAGESTEQEPLPKEKRGRAKFMPGGSK